MPPVDQRAPATPLGLTGTASESLLDYVETLTYVSDAVASLLLARMIEQCGAGGVCRTTRPSSLIEESACP